MRKYSFQPGWNQIKKKYGSEKRKEAREKTMAVFNVKYDGWVRRKRGDTDPTVDEKKQIDEIFRSYGIRTGIWGYETEEYKSTNAAGA